LDKNDFYKVVEKFSEKTGLDFTETEELFSICLDEISENCNNIGKYYYKGQFENVRSELHNIRGVSGSYMLDEILDLSKQVTSYLTEGSKLRFAVSLSNLNNEISNIKNILKDVFEEYKIRSQWVKQK